MSAEKWTFARIFSFGLGRRLMIWILLFSSLVTLTITAVQLYLDYERDVSLIRVHMEDIKSVHLDSIINSLWLANYEQVKINLEGLLRLPDMQYVIIDLEDGGQIAVGKNTGKHMIHLDLPLSYHYRQADVSLGTLHAAATLEGVYHRLLDKTFIIIASQGIKTFLVSLFILVLYYHLIGKRLQAFVAYTRVLDPTNGHRPFRFQGREKRPEEQDEMDQLVMAFNSSCSKLRESEETYRSLFDNMLNGFAYCQMLYENGEPVDFIYLRVNDAFEKLTGLSNVIGRKISEVLPGIRESDPSFFERSARVTTTGQPERFELFLNALRIWLAVAVYSPKPEHFVVIFEVINDRKLAEQSLTDEMVRWRTLFDHSRDGLCVMEIDGHVWEANPKFADMLGYTLDEMKSLHIWDWNAQWSREEVQAKVQEVNYEGITFTTRHRRKDGSLYDVEVSTCKMAWQDRILILVDQPT